jgi:hypothetical protein
MALSTEQLRPTDSAPQSVRDPRLLAKQRITSTPICRVHSGPQGAGFELHHASTSQPGIIKLDKIIYQIFEQLVGRFRRMANKPQP